MKIAVREWDHNGLAETRYLIDEQMRKVGWEADTVNLRYSKGTRPQKGHNIAIAEWPTDSDVGNKGYADYALFVGTKMVATIEAKAIHKDIPSVIEEVRGAGAGCKEVLEERAGQDRCVWAGEPDRSRSGFHIQEFWI